MVWRTLNVAKPLVGRLIYHTPPPTPEARFYRALLPSCQSLTYTTGVIRRDPRRSAAKAGPCHRPPRLEHG
ncbi:hypothetical protein GCM10023085_53800 [Actinomadura viridis]